jgi:hypothetical protein
MIFMQGDGASSSPENGCNPSVRGHPFASMFNGKSSKEGIGHEIPFGPCGLTEITEDPPVSGTGFNVNAIRLFCYRVSKFKSILE